MTNKEVNRTMYSLDVQSLQESPADGVLARIGGRFSTSAEPSRNDRMYTPELWQSVVNSDRVKEMLETKTFYGELSHPPRAAEFLSEVQMDNISHNIVELVFDTKSKELTGKIDILDTPSGRIAHTLLKYGSKLGISSRGIVMDSGYNNRGNVMDVDNYYLVTFDLVALPGIPNARLNPITEALQVTNRRPLLESLDAIKVSIEKDNPKKYEKVLGVLESIEHDIKTADELDDEELQEEIKNLSQRDTAENIDDEDIKVDELIDREDVEGAVLEQDTPVTGEEAEEAIAPKRKRKPTAKVTSAVEEDTGGDVSLSVGDVQTSTDEPADQFSNGFANMPKKVTGTQVKDIKGPKSTVNIFGNGNKKPKMKKFLETIENISTIEDVIKYVESLDGVERQEDGKVIINKDTVLFNTMLRLINSARLQSDANPLANLGGSIKDIAKSKDVPVEPSNDEYDQTDTAHQPIKKSIKPVTQHNTALESALSLVDLTTRRMESLQKEISVLQDENAVLEQTIEVLQKRSKSTKTAYTEALQLRDKSIAVLKERVSNVAKAKMQSANEAVALNQSYQALESAHATMKNTVAVLEAENKELKDKYAKATESRALTSKDKKIQRLLEAHSLSVEAFDDDEVERSANGSAYNHADAFDAQAEQMAKLLNRMVSKKK